MKAPLVTIYTFIASALLLTPAAFAARSDSVKAQSCSAPISSAADPSYDFFFPASPPSNSGEGLTACGVAEGGTLRVGLVTQSGECSVRAQGMPTMYRTFSNVEVQALLRIAASSGASNRSDKLGATRTDPDLFWRAFSEALAAVFKSDAVTANDSFCAEGTPPGQCVLPELYCCCAANNETCGGDGNSGGNGGGPPGGNSGQWGGSAPGGGAGGGENPQVRHFELFYFPPQGSSQPLFAIIDVERRRDATANNPFGICTRASESSGSPGANYSPSALRSEGCPDGFSWHPFNEFMGAMAGLVIAVPFAAPALAPALTIPGVAVGVGVVVGGYLIYRWWTAPSAPNIIASVTNACDNACFLVAAAMSVVTSVTPDTTAVFTKVAPIPLVRDAVDRLWRTERYIPNNRDPSCCAKVCMAALLGNTQCYQDCLDSCTFALADCMEVLYWTKMPGACSAAGRAAAQACDTQLM